MHTRLCKASPTRLNLRNSGHVQSSPGAAFLRSPIRPSAEMPTSPSPTPARESHRPAPSPEGLRVAEDHEAAAGPREHHVQPAPIGEKADVAAAVAPHRAEEDELLGQ